MLGYVIGWRERETPEGRTKVDVWFDHRPEKAVCGKTRKQAEDDCALLDCYRVKIPLSEGSEHVCGSFKVEERSPEEFVVFCEVPFVLRTGGESANKS